jgi:predicted amidohydrolase YtcJ
MPASDLLLTHARAFTANPARPAAEAVAVQGSRIVFVGSSAEAAAWRGPATRVIDCGGRTLLPGFIDSHFHLLWGSLELSDIQLAEAHDWPTAANLIRAYAAKHPDQAWLVGYGLRYDIAGRGQPFTRQHLDGVVADRPLILFAYDHHTAWANTVALQRAGRLHGGPRVAPNSEIVMAPDGTATGELREGGAYRPLLDLIAPPDAAQQRAALQRGMAAANRLGLTSVHNMDGTEAQISLYAAMEDAGEMPLRVYVPYSITPETPVEALAEAAAWSERFQGDYVRPGAVKFFMDGVIESYTALLLEPYAGRPGYRGDANYSAEHFTHLACEAERLGLQMTVHAIGDAAVRRTLDGYEAAGRANPQRPIGAGRHRVEHIEVIHPDDVARFAALGVIASMQPLHAPRDASGSDVWPLRVGPERWPYSFAWQTLRNAGARLAFGSDWPVVSQSPLAGLQAAVTRQPWAPGLPDQRQSLTDALLAYTRHAAYAEFQEQAKGLLAPGYLADLVLVSANLEATPPEAIGQVEVLLTPCNGRLVFEQ